MEFISFATVIIMAVTVLFTLTPQLHILQLNSYYNVRFWGYLKENIKTSSIMSVVFSALVCVLFFVSPVASLVLASLLSVIRVSHAIYKTKTAKKKIVYTGRVKRMYATATILLTALSALSIVFPAISVIALSSIIGFVPFFAMVVNLINAPI